MDNTPELDKHESGVNDESRSFGRALNLQSGRPIRAAFVTNICPHYRVKTFELISQKAVGKILLLLCRQRTLLAAKPWSEDRKFFVIII